MREFDKALEELSIARKAAEASRDYATLAQAWFIEEKLMKFKNFKIRELVRFETV